MMATDLSEQARVSERPASISETALRRVAFVLRVAAVVVLGPLATSALSTAHAQSRSDSMQSLPAAGTFPGNPGAVPFGVGERMDYDVKFSAAKVGTGSMEVQDISTVRGVPAWHTVFTVKGKIVFLINLNIMLESWFDVGSLNSRRFHEDQQYTGYSKNMTTEIFPERGMFKEGDKEERPTVANPLDMASMLYYVRTIPLEVGKTYTVSQYYKPEANPVTIKVVRRDTITVPAGKFATIVVQPRIKAKGIFAEDSKAEVWLSDDSTRMVVQLKSDLTVGSINLYLNKHRAGAPAPAPVKPGSN